MKIIQNIGLLLISLTFIYFLNLSLTENILELDSKNFDSFVENSKFVAVKFDAPWCLHCKSISPKYEEVANKISELQLTEPIKLAHIDAFNELSLSKRYNVEIYPSLLLFEKGNLKGTITGNNEPKDIINWLLKLTEQSII